MTSDQKQAIADEYYNSLELDPAARSKPQFCLCMIGLVGSGKTTVMHKIMEQIPMIQQAGDGVKILLRKNGFPIEYAPELGGIVSERLKHDGYNVAHDNDFARTDIREEHSARNRKSGIREVWIRIAPPEDFILSNLKKRQVDYFNDYDEQMASYTRRKELHLAEKAKLDALPYLYIFDPSRADIDQQVTEAVAKIRQYLQQV